MKRSRPKMSFVANHRDQKEVLQREFEEAAAHLVRVCDALEKIDKIDLITSRAMEAAAVGTRSMAGGVAMIVVVQPPGSERQKRLTPSRVGELHVCTRGDSWHVTCDERPDLSDGPYRTRDAAESCARAIGRSEKLRVIVHRKRESLAALK